MSHPAIAPIKQLPALTGVRGVAAVWVLLWHLKTNFYRVTGLSDIGFFEMSWFGVDIFFMLSGFILAHVHFRDFEKPTWRATSTFIFLRLSRIYPVHLFTLVAAVGFFLLTAAMGKPLFGRPRFSLDLFIANLFLVQSWGWADGDSWNVLAWSISTEWLMYLLFPVIASVLCRLRWGIGALICAAASLLAMYFTLRALGLDSTFSTYRFGVVRTLGIFLAGCFLYLAYRSGALDGWPWRALEVASVAWLLLAAFVWRSSFAACPAVALLILSLAMGQGVVSDFFASKPIVFLGDISYSLYMTHLVVLETWFLPFEYTNYDNPAAYALWLLASIPVAAVATLWTYRYIERPARIYLRRLAGR